MGMENILPEKKHSEISMYDIIHYNAWSCRGEEKVDHLFVVYRDKDGKKKVYPIKAPAMEIYFVKDEYRQGFTTAREYFPIDKTYPVKVPAREVLGRVYKELCKSDDVVAKQLKRVYQTAIDTKQYNSRKEIYKWPYVLMSDMDVADYYWVQIGYQYNLMHKHVIDKCFADIENDVYGLTSAEQAANMDPVNAVTLIFMFDENRTGGPRMPEVHTYLLRNHKRYPQQAEFERNLDKFYQACHDNFDRQTVKKKDKVKQIDVRAKYQIHMCDTEQVLLQSVFDHINREKPDICEFWNMPYDMPKMRNRMDKLGMNPIQVMSDSELFPKSMQFAQFHIDNRPIDIANRNSYIRMTSTTQYVDQMQNYAAIRKGMKAYGSNALDNIANIELGAGKWKFKKGINVTNAAIFDYWNFVLYNIRDVWSQVLIDITTNDTMTIIYDMNQQNCPLYQLMKQTKYQKFIYYTNYLRKGYVPGNNINTNYTRYESEEDQERTSEIIRRKKIRLALDKAGLDPDDVTDIMSDPESLSETLADLGIDDSDIDLNDDIDSIVSEEVSKAAASNMAVFADSIDRKLPLPGGLVGNPDNNSENGTELIKGVPSKHFYDDTVDMDYASEYPWVKHTRSVSRSTQIGRLVIPKKVSPYQNLLPLGQQKRPADNRAYIPGAEFISDYISQDWLSFGAVWFNLPLADEMSDIIKKKLGGK